MKEDIIMAVARRKQAQLIINIAVGVIKAALKVGVRARRYEHVRLRLRPS